MTWTAYTNVLDLGKGLLKITAKNSKLGKLNGMTLRFNGPKSLKNLHISET